LTLNDLTDYSKFLKTTYTTVQSAITGLINSLFWGQPDNSGLHIWDYIQGGGLAPIPNMPVAAASNFLYQVITAGSINILYKLNYAYIVGSPSNDCGSDTRGPKYLRFCIGDGNVYYFYMSVYLRMSSYSLVF
jgi:hypothetical protein